MKTNPETHNETRAVFDGLTHTDFPVEMHITTLAPGMAPHPPHEHVNEEILTIQQGTLEVTIMGKSTNMGPGSVAYIKSNEHHGWRNVGGSVAQYSVVALGPKPK